jgi:chromate transport protein ChrA
VSSSSVAVDSNLETSQQSPVALREAFWTWCRVAALSFGGPAGQIALMHRIIVDEKKWIGEERLRGNRLLGSALSAITATVVGVILNLAVWFCLHTLFAQVDTWQYGNLRIQLPEFATLQLAVLVVAVLAFLLTFYWKRGMAATLAICALAGAAVFSAQRLLGIG